MKQLLAFSCLLLFCGCPDDGVQPPSNPLQLMVEDATCTEAFLKLSLAENEQNRTVTLKRNDSTIAMVTIASSETLFVDEGLQPGQTYLYTFATNSLSATAQATTMDTTSHDWSFTLDTLGESNSYLLDVAIINDTLAYAVGEIHIGDSLYNIAKWNGREWKIQSLYFSYKILDPNSIGDTIGITRISSIFAFNDKDMWVTAGTVQHYNGIGWKQFKGDEAGNSNRIWGTSSSDLYFVGSNGSIVHYNGSSWQKMESGTTLGLSGIWGTVDNQVYACGLDYNQSKGIVLKNAGQGWNTMIEGDIIDSTQLFKPKLFGITEGLWIDGKSALYTVGNLMYQYRKGKWSLVHSLAGNNFTGNPNYLYRGYLHAIRGNASNDLFVVGEINTVRHFNGVTWEQIGLPYQPLNLDIFWYGCNVKKDVMMAVGKINDRASIIIAKR